MEASTQNRNLFGSVSMDYYFTGPEEDEGKTFIGLVADTINPAKDSDEVSGFYAVYIRPDIPIDNYTEYAEWIETHPGEKIPTVAKELTLSNFNEFLKAYAKRLNLVLLEQGWDANNFEKPNID